jgi:hypothetical protein
MIKPHETLEKSSKSFMFDPNLGESLQEKLLSEPLSSQQSKDSTDFFLKETTDQELLKDPLGEGFLYDAQLPQMHHQSEIEAFVTTLQTVGDADLKDFISHLRNCNLENSRYVKVFDKYGNRKLVKKQTVVWLLQDKLRKLSSDRTLRVRQTSEDLNSNKLQDVKRVEKRTIRPTNCCLYETENGDGKLLGHVMMFSLLNG